jgi:hypothetical protein
MRAMEDCFNIIFILELLIQFYITASCFVIATIVVEASLIMDMGSDILLNAFPLNASTIWELNLKMSFCEDLIIHVPKLLHKISRLSQIMVG